MNTPQFLTYEQQVDKLINDKGLLVCDRNFAIEHLRRKSYFALIDGYKYPLRNQATNKYKPGTTFDDIVFLYNFDAQLRQLFSEALYIVERALRSAVSYTFCENNGAAQEAYLNPKNFSHAKKDTNNVAKLIKIMSGLALKNSDYSYIVYQRKTHGCVPLWVTINAMTFGQVSKMYSYLEPSLQVSVAKQFAHVNEKELEQHVKFLVLYRNCCAHGERLFSHKSHTDIPDTKLHEKLNIPKKGSQYLYGKRDLFAVVISLRYLLPSDEFLHFKKKLIRLLAEYKKKCGLHTLIDVLKLMGFPENWANLTRFKL